jgi:hypothetical protein
MEHTAFAMQPLHLAHLEQKRGQYQELTKIAVHFLIHSIRLAAKRYAVPGHHGALFQAIPIKSKEQELVKTQIVLHI